MKYLILSLLFFTLQLSAQDMPLSQVLPETGGQWELVTEGYGHTDAACVDADGNFYFSDVKSGNTINKIDASGKVSVYAKDAERISGMQFGPNGILYACQGGSFKRIVKFDKEGKLSVLAENITPNDLVVTSTGWVYVTETKTRKIVAISPEGKVKRYEITNYEAGLKHGNWIQFYSSGKTKAEGVYKDWNLDGRVKWLYASGKIEIDGYYKHAVKNGFRNTMKMMES